MYLLLNSLRRSLVAVLAVVLMAPAAAAAQSKGSAQRSDRAAAESALQRVKDLKQGIGVRTGREVSPALLDLANRRSALDSAGRAEATALLQRPTSVGGDGLVDYSVAEATPFCNTNFCIHYVTSTADAPSLTNSNADPAPDYVEQMAAEFEFVYSIENGDAQLDWNDPPSDGTRGGDARTDVYIAQIGDQGIYGYAATDPGQSGNSQFAYQVMDDDYVEFSPTPPLTALQVTAAHEYNHVLQYGYDAIQDIWMFESTATWAEEKVYPAGDDYLLYLPNWASCTESPLTFFSNIGCGQKVYGSAVWNHWLESEAGTPDVIRDAWGASLLTSPQSFAPGAYNQSIVAHGDVGFGDEFGRFSAAVAEWRASDSVFPDHALYPDVARIGTSLTVGGGSRTVQLDHTTFELINVTVPASGVATLEATAPAGTRSAIALVGRTGDATGGTATEVIQQLPSGGAGTVTLPNASSFARITAVIVNSDTSQSGFNSGQQDWNWTNDNQNFQNVRVTAVDPTGPPDTTITGGPADASTTGPSTSFSFTATDAGAGFECKLDAEPAFTTCTSPENLSGLSNGSHTFSVRAVNANGPDASPATRTWNVDANAPQTTIDGGPTGTVAENDATFTFSSSEPTGATFKCKLDAEPTFTTCSSPRTYNDLADGSHTFQVKATDQHGNEDATAASQTWTIDAPPDANITSQPALLTNSQSAHFEFNATEGDATFTCQLDSAPVIDPCTSPQDFSSLGEGSHAFQVTAFDGVSALEGSTDSYTWTVDLTPPGTSIDTGPTHNSTITTSSATFTFSGTGAPSGFRCRFDSSGAFAPCTSPQSFTSLADGAHTFEVKAVDAAGNEDATPEVRTFTVDDPPEVDITSGPPALTNSQSATFYFAYANETGSGFECRLDGTPGDPSGFGSCSSPKTYPGVAEGGHRFYVRALDAADSGPGSPADRAWTVDVTPPDTTIDSGPSGEGNSSSASFAFSSTEGSSTFQCSLDSGAFLACGSPFGASGLGSGVHSFAVKARDQAGNFDPSPATRSWTVGTTTAPPPPPPPVAPPPPPPPPVVPPPPPPPPATAFVLEVSAPSRRSFATAFASGIRASVRCTRACSGTAELLLDRRTAKRLGLKQRLGRVSFRRTSTRKSAVTVKIARKARSVLGRQRSVRITLRVRATDAAGTTKSVSKKILLKR